jgi:hypothetical protein
MALMTVNKHNEQGKDHWAQPRWSAGKKTEAVLRLLRAHGLLTLQRAARAASSAAARRHDHPRAAQPALGHRCHHGLDSIGWLGIADDAAFWASRRPTVAPSAGPAPSRSSACGRTCTTPVDQLRQAVAGFVQTYNSQWLIGRLGHRTPREAYQAVQTTAAA